MHTGFLSELMHRRSQIIKSPLNECIMLVAMCARTLFHAQQYRNQPCLYSYGDSDRLEWQNWLDNVLSSRLQTLAEDYPSPVNSPDPTLLFANFLAQATVIYLWKGIRFIERRGDNSRGQRLAAEYQQRARSAVERTVELAHSLSDFPYFKASISLVRCRLYPLT